MTKNQIEYSKLLESNRANLAQEALTRKRDTQTHQRGLRELRETSRSNRARESNLQAQLDETRRANVARELEAQRAALASERNVAARMELEHADRIANLDLNREYQSGQIALQSVIAQENARHNLQTELLKRMELSEQSRRDTLTHQANMASVGLGYSQLAETNRANQTRELEQHAQNIRSINEQTRSNMAREEETYRSNRAKESENVRHNSTSENLTKRGQNLGAVSTALSNILKAGVIAMR